MHARAKVNIYQDPVKPFMGPGPLRLLEKIKEYKSINKAAKSMDLSYVKALNMLDRLEINLGRKILIRKRGGNERGGTELTPYGEIYIEHYRHFEENISNFAEREFQIFQKKLKIRSKNENV